MLRKLRTDTPDFFIRSFLPKFHFSFDFRLSWFGVGKGRLKGEQTHKIKGGAPDKTYSKFAFKPINKLYINDLNHK